MTTTNNTIAKFAAVVAMLGLVASSAFAFAPAAKAQSSTDLQAQINALLAQIAALQGNTGTSASVSFATDLTIGSTGSDVTALQNWLISKGFTIAAGATGYFGAQTASALGAYQASVGISPAVGYFGPITRAKVNAAAVPGTGTGTGTGSSNGGSLSGGEANLTDFNLRSEDSDGNEGEEGVEIATAEFDVEDGDVRVERVEVEFSATSNSIEDRPWQYFDTIYLMVDGDEIADIDASDRDAWDETGADDYEIVFTGLDYVVEEGDMASITIVADIASNIDTADLAQDFNVRILDEGIRAVDAEGIQQYIGQDTGETVSFGFGAEENGDLSIRESDENPEAANLKIEDDEVSEEYTVFAFEIRNTDDVDSLLTELAIGTTITGATTTDRVIRTATLVVDGDEYDGDIASTNDGDITFDDLDVVLAGDDTTSFELMVEFTAQVGNYASGDTIEFDVAPAGVDAEGEETGSSVASGDITGGADSELHTLSLTGFMVEAVSTSQSSDNSDTPANSTGTFTIKFDVTADEDEPVYVDNVAANASTTASTTAGAAYKVFRNGVDATLAFTSENAVLTSTADMSSDTFRVDAGATETFTLTVTINPAESGLFAIELDAVNYGTSAAAASNASLNETLDIDGNNSDFETDPVSINN